MTVRQDFEMAVVFGIEGISGDLVKTTHDTYKDAGMQAAWIGFQAAVRGDHAQLARFDHTRWISPTDRAALKGAAGLDMYASFISDEMIEMVARAVLKHFAGVPA